jgi:hypothetical protein
MTVSLFRRVPRRGTTSVMLKREPFPKPKHDYTIELLGKTSEPRVYSVKISGNTSRHFFVEITTTQNVRAGIPRDIEWWCKQHYDRLPEDGKRIAIDLDEVVKA